MAKRILCQYVLPRKKQNYVKLDDKYTFTNASNDEFEEKGRHNDDPDPDGKKPNE